MAVGQVAHGVTKVEMATILQWDRRNVNHPLLTLPHPTTLDSCKVTPVHNG